MALVVVTRVREMRPYIQGHHIVVKTNHPPETDINFVPHESVKSHVLSNFLVQLDSPIEFKASKNHDEYKTLIKVMTLAMEMGIIIFEKIVTLNW